MKFFISLIILFLHSGFLSIKAQDSFRGLFAESYFETQKNGELQKINKPFYIIYKINKPFYIIYNRTYCQFSLNGSVSSFQTDAYSSGIKEGNIQEGFLNAETKTINRGWYSIEIVHDKKGKSTITVNMPLIPGGKAIVAPNAQVYSENGKVTGKVFINNWKELEQKLKYEDSLSKTKLKFAENVNVQKNSDDSTGVSKRDSFLFARQETALNNGNNFNQVNLNPLANVISQKMKPEKKDYFYSNFKVIIDKDGLIIDAFPDGKGGNIIDKYVPLIKNELLNKQVSPYRHKNGKTYQSYAFVYISLVPNN
jgi:hypothetical protein